MFPPPPTTTTNVTEWSRLKTPGTVSPSRSCRAVGGALVLTHLIGQTKNPILERCLVLVAQMATPLTVIRENRVALDSSSHAFAVHTAVVVVVSEDNAMALVGVEVKLVSHFLLGHDVGWRIKNAPSDRSEGLNRGKQFFSGIQRLTEEHQLMADKRKTARHNARCTYSLDIQPCAQGDLLTENPLTK